MSAAIEIESVSKRYRLDRQVGAVPVPTVLGFTVKEARKPGFHGDDVDDDDDDDDGLEELEEDERVTGPQGEIWALRDISLTVPRGESLGIVGPNGSGKSTLLKVLASVTPPTEGHVRFGGRPSPLLSAASVLAQPELTVAQNVRLMGDLLGLPRKLVARRLDEVLRFAELEDRAEMKLKRASPGMASRLGFSIAVNLDSAILLSDGTPAVGDATFRARCLERVEALLADGVSLVLASEDVTLIRRLCQQTAWLDEGRLVQCGPTAEVLRAYFADRSRPDATRGSKQGRANEFARLVGASITRPGGEPVDVLGPDDAAVVEIEIEALRPLDVDFTVLLFADGAPPRTVRSPLDWHVAEPGRAVARFDLQPGALDAGRYVARAGVWVTADGRRLKLVEPNAFAFDVDDARDDDEEGGAYVGEPVHGVSGWRLEA